METFIDFYEILEVDFTADPQTIESQFFELGQRFHPDVPLTGDKDKFELLTKAFQILRSPDTRDEYNEIYNEHKSEFLNDDEIEDNSDASMENMDLEKERNDRIRLMQQFYERRRVNYKNPGLAAGSLDGVINCSHSMIDFHLWYCLQKAWLFREESGQLSITAEGVDFVERGLRATQESVSDDMP